MKRKLIFVAIALIFGNSHESSAESFSHANLEVFNVWARATPRGAQTAAVYIERVHNSGEETDRIVKVNSILARKSLIHKTEVEGGIAKMIHVKNLEIQAGTSLSFKPGGLHIMMIGIQKPLKQRARFPMTLEFEKAGKIRVTVAVRSIGFSQKRVMDQKREHHH